MRSISLLIVLVCLVVIGCVEENQSNPQIIEDCANFEGDSERYDCYKNFSLRTASVKTCKRIPYDDLRSNCTENAIDLQLLKTCDRVYVRDFTTNTNCVVQAAINLNYIEVCNRLSTAVPCGQSDCHPQDSCWNQVYDHFKDLAIESGNSSVCLLLGNRVPTEKCLSELPS